jgi:TPR repeat protein
MVTKNIDQAAEWFYQAAKHGDRVVKSILNNSHKDEVDFQQYYTSIFDMIDKLAKFYGGHNATAQFYLGACYEQGLGVSKSYTQALYWYGKSAEQGFAVAQFNLGNSYYNGNEVTQDYEQAVYWYRKAAEQELALAQLYLGNCYGYDDGVTQNSSEAVYWWRKAAKKGYSGAQFRLAECYENGYGVEKDGNTALYYYELSINDMDGTLSEQGKILAEKGIKELKEKGYSSMQAKP